MSLTKAIDLLHRSDLPRHVRCRIAFTKGNTRRGSKGRQAKSAVSSAAAVALFARHTVPLMVRCELKGEVYVNTITTFVHSVHDRWFLVTAAHALDQIREALASGGLVEAMLVADYLRGESGLEHTIPFDFADAAILFGAPLDCAAIEISDEHRAALTRCGVVPVDESLWKSEPPQGADLAYVVAGFPIELLASGARFGFAVHAVAMAPDISIPREVPPADAVRPMPKEVTKSPSKSTPPDPRDILARVEMWNPVTQVGLSSALGMSGGPLFAFHRANGKSRYWVRGLYVAQSLASGTDWFCPLLPLASHLERMVAPCESSAR